MECKDIIWQKLRELYYEISIIIQTFLFKIFWLVKVIFIDLLSKMKYTSISLARLSLILMATHLLMQASNANDSKPGNGPKYDVVIGSIMMWSGSIESIPQNWALCNGDNNTPDLRDKFMIGAGNLFNVHDIGGQFNIVLNNGQLPNHNHNHIHPISDANINVGSDGIHKHNNIEGDLIVDSDTLRHQHSVNLGTSSNTISAGRLNVDVVDIGIGGAGLLNSPGGNQRALWSTPQNNGAHVHSVNGYTGLESPGDDNITIDTSDLSTDMSISHIHCIDGITDGEQGGQIGNGEQIDITNPYYSLCFIMKISNWDNSLKHFNSKNSEMNVIYNRGHNDVNYDAYMTDNILFYILVVSLLLVLTCGVFNVFTFYKMNKIINGHVQYEKCDMIAVDANDESDE